jgi:hypothetical protein
MITRGWLLLTTLEDYMARARGLFLRHPITWEAALLLTAKLFDPKDDVFGLFSDVISTRHYRQMTVDAEKRLNLVCNPAGRIQISRGMRATHRKKSKWKLTGD